MQISKPDRCQKKMAELAIFVGLPVSVVLIDAVRHINKDNRRDKILIKSLESDSDFMAALDRSLRAVEAVKLESART